MLFYLMFSFHSESTEQHRLVQSYRKKVTPTLSIRNLVVIMEKNDQLGKGRSVPGDDRRTNASIAGTGGAAAWLDDRIAEQRKLGPSFNPDNEAKERARKDANASGIKREGVAKITSHPPRSSLSSTGTGASDEDTISTSRALRRDSNQPVESSPVRSNPFKTTEVACKNNVIRKNAAMGEMVRLALNELEKDVLLTMPNTSPLTTVSHKSQGQHNTESSNTEHAALARMESEVESKIRARTSPPGSVVSKRLDRKEQYADGKGQQFGRPSKVTAASLNRMEEDVASKARAMGSHPSSSVTKRNRMKELIASETCTTGSQSDAFVASKLGQMKLDVGSKERAIGSPYNAKVTQNLGPTLEKDIPSAPVKEHFNHLNEDFAANARPTSTTINKQLSQMEEDVTVKARSIGSPPGTTITKRLNQKENGFERLNRQQDELAILDSSIVATDTTMHNEQNHPIGKKGMTQLDQKNLSQTEKDVLSKVAARSTAPPHNLENVIMSEDRVASKTGVSSFGANGTISARQQIRHGAFATMSTNLEERIAYKTGIPLVENEENAVDSRATEKQRTATSSANERQSKLGSVPPAALPLTKTVIPFESTMVSGMQNQMREGTPLEYHLDLDGFGNDDVDDRLAVAFAVKDENEDVFIPAAVEYDPDAKPPIYKNRRFRMYGILGCSLLIMIVACMIGILASQKEDESSTLKVFPTAAPNCARCDLGIEGQLELIVGSAELNDSSTPYFQAKEWILHEDPMELLPDAPNLVQRFLLAVFYFDSHKEADWISCNRDIEGKNETCSLQKIVGISPLEYEGVAANRWLSSLHECSWAGIFCDELNQTRGVDLHGQGMQGAFPVSLTQLRYVQTLSFSWNNFTGTIPEEIGTMKHLLNLELHYNQFTGSLPGSWTNAKTLQLMNVAGNFLSGQIPSDIKFLSNLKGIFLSENMLTGGFPDEFAQVSLLSK
jgi:hypothetical protein